MPLKAVPLMRKQHAAIEPTAGEQSEQTSREAKPGCGYETDTSFLSPTRADAAAQPMLDPLRDGQQVSCPQLVDPCIVRIRACRRSMSAILETTSVRVPSRSTVWSAYVKTSAAGDTSRGKLAEFPAETPDARDVPGTGVVCDERADPCRPPGPCQKPRAVERVEPGVMQVRCVADVVQPSRRQDNVKVRQVHSIAQFGRTVRHARRVPLPLRHARQYTQRQTLRHIDVNGNRRSSLSPSRFIAEIHNAFSGCSPIALAWDDPQPARRYWVAPRRGLGGRR
ncbi:hypothetical protein GCM10027610_072720 [Dactylosporangium cerinum]